MKKTYNLIITVLFTAFIFVFGILHIVLPDGVLSESERRRLAQFPEISADAVSNGTFMQNLEKYLPDQFPLREPFRTTKALFEKFSGRLDASDIYAVNGSYSALDPALNENSVIKAGQKMEKIHDLLQPANAYLAIIPQKTYYMEDGVHPRLDFDRLTELLVENTPDFQSIDLTGTLSLDSYYKTDSHWRQELLQDTVLHLVSSMGQEPVWPSYTENTVDGFHGVYVGQSALPIPAEPIHYLTNADTENTLVTAVGAECDALYTLSKLDDEKSVDMYDIFLGGPVPLITIENPHAQTDGTLILVRDSFGSSISPLLSAYYKTIYVVDLRYIASPVLPQLIPDSDQADLLVLLSTGVLNNSEMLKVQ